VSDQDSPNTASEESDDDQEPNQTARSPDWIAGRLDLGGRFPRDRLGRRSD